MTWATLLSGEWKPGEARACWVAHLGARTERDAAVLTEWLWMRHGLLGHALVAMPARADLFPRHARGWVAQLERRCGALLVVPLRDSRWEIAAVGLVPARAVAGVPDMLVPPGSALGAPLAMVTEPPSQSARDVVVAVEGIADGWAVAELLTTLRVTVVACTTAWDLAAWVRECTAPKVLVLPRLDPGSLPRRLPVIQRAVSTLRDRGRAVALYSWRAAVERSPSSTSVADLVRDVGSEATRALIHRGFFDEARLDVAA